MSIDVALSTRRVVGRDTYSLPKKNAAAPRVARQWVRPRSSAMSIDVALSTRRDVGGYTYSLPQENAAAPRCHVNGHATTKLRPGAMSMDMALLSCAASGTSMGEAA